MAGFQPVVAAADEALSQPEYEVVFEKDVAIPVRDGTVLRADVYRPAVAAGDSTKFPVLVSLSAYQKSMDRVLPHVRPFTHVERPEPDWWVARGYVLVFIDTRGTGTSPGKADIWSMQETRDYYDAIEWAARQDWSTGKVGLSGVSYYAITQWNVASLQPPSLTTIVPWEGWADLYRDSVFHGGVLNQAFYGRWWIDVVGKQLLEFTRADNSAAFDENLMWNFMTHHTDSPWWDEVKSRAQFDKITVPLYSSGNWGGWNHHLRGNIDAYVRSASKSTRSCRVHIGRARRCVLLGRRQARSCCAGTTTGSRTATPASWTSRPSSSACRAGRVAECTWRFEDEWPLARTRVHHVLPEQPKNAGVVDDAVHDRQPESRARRLTRERRHHLCLPGPRLTGARASGQPTVSL